MYTAIFNNYDAPKPVKVKEKGITYRMFTDGDGAKGWDVQKSKVLHRVVGGPRHAARVCKVMTPVKPLMGPTDEFDWYLWLDGTMEIVKPISKSVPRWLEEYDFAAFKHPWWQCAYQEIQKCLERGKSSKKTMEKVRDTLKRRKFPVNYGQLASGILLRKNTETVKLHARAWWKDMQEHTMRDQATFMVNTWALGAGVEWMKGCFTDNKWFKYHRGHTRR